MQDLHEGWGERIAEELRDRDMSQAELARRCGVDPATISRVIHGSLCPHDELKWKIAGALSIRMDRLWTWPQVIPPAPVAA